ncbi:hypothetical protein TNCV_2916681 [Trichonephila clavipes]|nr:hypothetical protein TNCV_2916681 [Trichonephila clavipes]
MATASAVKMLRSVELTVHNISNHDSTANVICVSGNLSSVDGRITTILTAVVGEDALKTTALHSGFTSLHAGTHIRILRRCEGTGTEILKNNTQGTKASSVDLREADDDQHRDSAPVMCETHPSDSQCHMVDGGRFSVVGDCTLIRIQHIRSRCERVRLPGTLVMIFHDPPPEVFDNAFRGLETFHTSCNVKYAEGK